MKRSFTIFVMALLFSSCGVLKITPRSCSTEAAWGASPESTREITKTEIIEAEKSVDVKMKEKIFVFHDHEIKLRDLLDQEGIKCKEVKKLRVLVFTRFFFWREVTLKVVKN